MCAVAVLPPPGGDFSFTFPPDVRWVRSAREAIRTALWAVSPSSPEKSDLVEKTTLLTSEVVTNAVVASLNSVRPSPVALYAAWTPAGAVRVSVHDSAPGVPQPPAGFPLPEDEHGRGLLLIDLYASDWGVCHHTPGPGKLVWFTISGGLR